ncbi:MAG: 4Fe-4S dicluster domain-containing protein [Thermoprotei archaeon]
MPLKLAVVPLSSCDGCQYNLLSKEFLDFIRKSNIELVFWSLLGLKNDVGTYDIALIEGSVMSSRDLETLLKTRIKSRILIAMGACAVLGGIQAGLNNLDMKKPEIESGFSKPISHYVNVDYYVRGCPANTRELIKLLKDLVSGTPISVSSRRFNQISRDNFRISGMLIEIDTSKCVVCGRCVEACSLIGAKVLNYVSRGTQTIISTPYQESLENAGCINCGLCFAYCPVGAISLKTKTKNLLDRVREGSLKTAYIEPEALASLAESENLDLEQIVSALKLIGFLRVYVYSNLREAKDATGGTILARSPVEFSILNKQLSEYRVHLLTPRIPQDAVFITQCLSWKNTVNSLTTRELQSLIRELGTEELGGEKPDGILDYREDIIVVNELKSLKQIISNHTKSAKKVIFEACPGGCLLGGGQPVSRSNDLTKVLVRREEALKKLHPTC